MKIYLLFIATVLSLGLSFCESNAMMTFFEDRSLLLQRTKSELSAIMQKFFYSKSTPYINSSIYIQEEYFYDYFLNITVMNQTNHFDPFKLQFNYKDDGFHIDGKDAFKMTVFFKFNSKLSLRPVSSGIGTFTVIY